MIKYSRRKNVENPKRILLGEFVHWCNTTATDDDDNDDDDVIRLRWRCRRTETVFDPTDLRLSRVTSTV